jgi:hypothetical protein
MMPRNWLVSWNAPCCAPVAASPESSVSALARLAPVSPKMVTKAPGSAPPLLKKALSALATLHWLTLKTQARAPGPLDALGLLLGPLSPLGALGLLLGPLGPLGALGCPSVAVRLRIALVAV